MSWNVLYILDIFAILLFAVSYYRNCYSKGYRFDFWHWQIFSAFVVPGMILLPFSRSEINVGIVGQDFMSVVAALPQVFLISLLGYVCFLIGGGFWRLHLGIGLRKTTAGLLDFVPRCSRMMMSSQRLLVFHSFLCFFLQAFMLAMYFSHSGFGFDLRGYTFANPQLRPIALIASNYSIITGSHAFARYADTKERSLLACTLLLSFGLLFFGSRSSIVFMYMGVLFCQLVKLRSRVKILRLGIYGSLVLIVGLYLGSIRQGDYSLSQFFGMLGILIFYGNNFSDLRDFAWVYAKWDHVLWLGKTYLAASFSFVPRFASQFRDTWAVGVIVDTTVGLDPQVHPGLRPGVFGESFFNFGLPGVIVLGIILGLAAKRVDLDVKSAVAPPEPSIRKAFASTMLLGVVGNLSVSGGFSGMYILAGVYVFSWLCLQLLKLSQIRYSWAQS